MALSNSCEPIPDQIDIALGVDGFSVFKSCRTQSWPVLCSIENFKTEFSIFPLAITVGDCKPKNNDFLLETIADLNDVMTNGYFHNGHHHDVQVKFCVCDVPGRCLVKNIKYFNGFFGRDKCRQRVTTAITGRTICFKEVSDWEPRTDDNYRNRIDPDHHRGRSPFEDLLNCDMVSFFPCEYMYSVCLGVTKRLMQIWFRNKLSNVKKLKLNEGLITEVSKRLVAGLRDKITADFACQASQSLRLIGALESY